MTLEIRLSPEATQDRERLAQFLVEKSPAAAISAIETIVGAISRLSRFPYNGRDIGDERRELSIPFGKSGYIAQYRIEPDAVIVARIFHMREDR